MAGQAGTGSFWTLQGEGSAHVTIATSAHNRSPRHRGFPLISVPSLGSAGLSSSMRLCRYIASVAERMIRAALWRLHYAGSATTTFARPEARTSTNERRHRYEET